MEWKETCVVCGEVIEPGDEITVTDENMDCYETCSKECQDKFHKGVEEILKKMADEPMTGPGETGEVNKDFVTGTPGEGFSDYGSYHGKEKEA